MTQNCFRIKNVFSRLWPAFLIALMFLTGLANAHEVRPTIADFRTTDNGKFEISVSLNIEALMAEIGVEHSDTDDSPNAQKYNALRALQNTELEARFGETSKTLLQSGILKFGETVPDLTLEKLEIPQEEDQSLPRISTMVLSGDLPEGAGKFTWQWPAAYGQSVIRVAETPDPADPAVGYSAFLTAGEVSQEIPIKGAARGFFEVVAEYIYIGFTHILPKGLDHILFVVGLFLLSTKLSTLLWQVTSFTLAHSVTLALGVLGIVQLSPAIVEPLIAASIVYVCVENIMTSKLNKWRPLIIFAFGLLHGLGFAGVLQEIGLAPGQFVTALVAFNVGVELGQLAVIAICFVLVGFWFQNKPWYRNRITIPASIAIALIGAWWFVERTFLG